jgi:type II secretion system protein N
VGGPAEDPDSRGGRVLRNLLWSVFALICLVFFTVVKLPETRVKAWIQGQVVAALAQQGIGFSAQETHLSMLLGLKYEMKGVTLTPPAGPLATEVKLERVSVSPSPLALLTGKIGGGFEARQGEGSLRGTFRASPSGGPLDLALTTDKLNVGRMGLLALAGGIQASSLLLDSDIDLHGDPSVPSTLSGDVRLKPSRLVIEPQSIQGFPIPRITISTGDINLHLSNGRAVLRTATVGKPGSADDVVGTATGDIALARSLPASQLNLTVRFNLSPAIKSGPLGLVDSLLASMGAKQPDGSYALHLTGTLEAPVAGP